MLTLNGREVEALAGETILQVARREGVEIPTLCHQDGVEPASVCRLCLVELTDAKRVRLVTACSYPLTKSGLSVQTDTEGVLHNRRVIVELLLARCPESDVLQNLAARLGVTCDRFPAGDPAEKCILCGLCERVCEDAVKVRGISRAHRGIHRRMMAPFAEPPAGCTGCRACEFVCPTGAVVASVAGNLMSVDPWGAEVEMAECSCCGDRFAPRAALRHAADKLGIEPEYLSVCLACRQTRHGQELAKAVASSAARAVRESQRKVTV
ncbi:MAG: 2Fe-2S iron-sulfur cluster-binding protein [Armatimonadota bacterium]